MGRDIGHAITVCHRFRDAFDLCNSQRVWNAHGNPDTERHFDALSNEIADTLCVCDKDTLAEGEPKRDFDYLLQRDFDPYVHSKWIVDGDSLAHPLKLTGTD